MSQIKASRQGNPKEDKRSQVCSDLLPNNGPQIKGNNIVQPQYPLSLKTENETPVVGVLLSHWYNSKKRLMARNLGSAFAITPSLILTCTHNIYVSSLQRSSDQLFFYPSPPSVSRISEVPPLKAHPIAKEEYTKVSFEIRPIKEELQLLRLEEPLDSQPYLKIGNFSTFDPADNNLRIFGYPQQKKGSQISDDRAGGGMAELEGALVSYPQKEGECELRYNIKTVKGVSGSPVMGYSSSGWVVVGIHTHQGYTPDYNAGLYLTDELLQRIKQLQSLAKEDFKLVGSVKLHEKEVAIVKQKSQQSQKPKKAEDEKGQFLDNDFVDLNEQIEEGSDLSKIQLDIQLDQHPEQSGSPSDDYENSSMMDPDDSFSNKSVISLFDELFLDDEDFQTQGCILWLLNSTFP